jgi:uncharacterized protein YjaZ
MITLNFDENSPKLEPFKSKIEGIFNASIKKIQSKIPIDNVSITIFDKPEHTIPETGEGGYSHDANRLDIYLNRDFPEFESKVIVEKLERVLAHELHHCLRWKNPGYGETLLEQIITEGLADHFEVEISGREPGMWSTNLTPEQIQEWLQKAKPLFSSKDFDRNAWMFGSNEIPRWTGYSLGFYLVGEYLKTHPKEKASTLYDRKAEEFLKSGM